MAWLAVNEDGRELVFDAPPVRRPGNPVLEKKDGRWAGRTIASCVVELPKGSIQKLHGKELTWADAPVNI